jgi:hypothetical protein
LARAKAVTAGGPAPASATWGTLARSPPATLRTKPGRTLRTRRAYPRRRQLQRAKTWDERLGTKDLGAKDPGGQRPWGQRAGAKELGPKVEGLLGAKKVLTKRSTAPRLSMACRCQFEGAFQKHDSRCELEGETATHEVKLQIQPKVTFSQGKAVKATLNWGKIAAPRLAKTGGRQRLGHVAASSWTTSTGSFIGAKGGVAGQITARLYPRCAPARAPNRSCLCGASPSPPHPRRGRRFP